MSKVLSKAEKIERNLRQYKRNGLSFSELELKIYKLGIEDGILIQMDTQIEELKKKLAKGVSDE